MVGQHAPHRWYTCGLVAIRASAHRSIMCHLKWNNGQPIRLITGLPRARKDAQCNRSSILHPVLSVESTVDSQDTVQMFKWHWPHDNLLVYMMPVFIKWCIQLSVKNIECASHYVWKRLDNVETVELFLAVVRWCWGVSGGGGIPPLIVWRDRMVVTTPCSFSGVSG